MKVLFLLFIGLDRHETSEHLLTAVMEQVCLAGHSVHIIQKDTGGDLPSIPRKLSGYHVTTETIPFIKSPKNKLASRYRSEIQYVFECKKRIKKEYDAVFIQSNTVAGLAVRVFKKKLPGARITLNIQDIFPYNALFSGKIKNKLLFKLFAFEQRYGYRHCDRIITISEDMKDTLITDGVDEKKIDVIYNWSYQDSPYSGLDLSSVSCFFQKDFFNVVYAGNIGVMQNVDIIIEASNLLKNEKEIWFHIFGGGTGKDNLITKAKKYGINNISFWPMQQPELAPAIYSAADINIIPLLKNVFKTALPSKTASCLACGKPIIFAIGKDSKFAEKAARVPGCVVVDSDSPEELAKAIMSIKDNQMKCESVSFFLESFVLSKNSRQYAEIITGSI